MGAPEQLRRVGGEWCVFGVDGESAAVDIGEEEALAWPQSC